MTVANARSCLLLFIQSQANAGKFLSPCFLVKHLLDFIHIMVVQQMLEI